ncbi:MAG: hypothetical protein F6K39_25810 [Okeania sp. SIO3B3]|nr:hypothetical protein [Okeania sp. SIO3B3]
MLKIQNLVLTSSCFYLYFSTYCLAKTPEFESSLLSPQKSGGKKEATTRGGKRESFFDSAVIRT